MELERVADEVAADLPREREAFLAELELGDFLSENISIQQLLRQFGNLVEHKVLLQKI